MARWLMPEEKAAEAAAKAAREGNTGSKKRCMGRPTVACKHGGGGAPDVTRAMGVPRGATRGRRGGGAAA